jgi:hypothetical protein
MATQRLTTHTMPAKSKALHFSGLAMNRFYTLPLRRFLRAQKRDADITDHIGGLPLVMGIEGIHKALSFINPPSESVLGLREAPPQRYRG